MMDIAPIDAGTLGIIIAIAAMGISFVGSMLGMFLWNRGEANSDRKEISQVLRELKDEMKDFHTRLLTLEERYLQMMQRILEKEDKR